VLGFGRTQSRSGDLLYLFEDYELDTERRELRRGPALVAIEPKVFDLLAYVIENRQRVVSRDDLIAQVWDGRIVSESALARCINGARSAIGDSGEAQRLIKTLPRKGVRFVGKRSNSSQVLGGELTRVPGGYRRFRSSAKSPLRQIAHSLGAKAH
jgi:DNA-binding winged helix-turn-helix (wHTH) protein